jgi:hypothetical protein
MMLSHPLATRLNSIAVTNRFQTVVCLPKAYRITKLAWEEIDDEF